MTSWSSRPARMQRGDGPQLDRQVAVEPVGETLADQVLRSSGSSAPRSTEELANAVVSKGRSTAVRSQWAYMRSRWRPSPT